MITRYRQCDYSLALGMGLAQDKLDALGIDAICERICDGETMTHLSQEVGVGIGTLITWLGTPERSARANEARRLAAQVWDEMAEVSLLTTDIEEIARARELAQHYRWRASKIAPKTYGDSSKVELSGKVDMGFADTLKAARQRAEAEDAS